VQLIASLLGLTWSAIRARIVSQGVPDQALTAAEAAVPEAQLLAREGLPGLWQQITSKLGDIKAMILGRLSEFLIPTVLIAGITWIISLLNPASAFVKAVKAIIDIVTFIFERGAQILEFVNSVLDAIIAIAGGGAGGVPALVENALARSIPVLIGFLAALLGVGGLADKVKSVFQAVSRPVMKVVDWVVDKITGAARRLWAKVKGKLGGTDKGAPAKRLAPEQESLSMAGESHMLTATPSSRGGTVEMASEKGSVSSKAARTIAAFAAKGIPPKAGQIDALREIETSARKLEAITAKAAVDGKTNALIDYPGFADAFRSLKALVIQYATRYKSKDISADLLAADRKKLVEEVATDLRALASTVRDQLVADPVKVDEVLSPGEIGVLDEKPFLWRANFGKAMERVLDARIATSPKLRKYLTHIGGSGREDWLGKDLIEGAKFDLTTDNAATITKHEGRWWWDKKVDVLINYKAPPEN